MIKRTPFIALLTVVLAFSGTAQTPQPSANANRKVTITHEARLDQFQGFWLGQCIANWTGLITEMDKIGNIGAIQTGAFYTREDWGKPDQPNIWDKNQISKISPVIDFVLDPPQGIWGADDDTDVEYIYQELLHQSAHPLLTGAQIKAGWLKHMRKEEENYLWVSNQKALDLMYEGMEPPATGDPIHNPEYAMIDAQLTTEIFGLYAPGRPDIALQLSLLPIQNTARREAQAIAEFYVILHSLAAGLEGPVTAPGPYLHAFAARARQHLKDQEYPAKMYDFVRARYEAGIPWEQTRDEVYQRYQVAQQDGYRLTAEDRYCNACFAAGINFAASLISLFYGEGDYKKTIQIGSLCGWDSDNPTATWGGLLGFMLGQKGIEKIFNKTFPTQFNIHRTRVGFPNNGVDDFKSMAQKGIAITTAVIEKMKLGKTDANKNWRITTE
jgi:hypothetical protein